VCDAKIQVSPPGREGKALMKVVLFCGGLGMRLREVSEALPKPMVTIGYRPILWHLMKFYAHYGHKDFIVCLGYRGDVIKNYFLNYDECTSNDFILAGGPRNIKLLSSDTHDWTITFVDTGLYSNIGQRLKAVEKFLEGEVEFLANYSDGLTDCPLPDQIEYFRKHDTIASFLCVRPNLSYHFVSLTDEGRVTGLRDVRASEIYVNGGYFIFKPDIFRHIREGEELVAEPFQRLIRDQQVVAYPHDGFWMGMDTFKDRQRLEELYEQGLAPWEVWKGASAR
jgi:glucose-1-phosphate cytidylyltransferase